MLFELKYDSGSRLTEIISFNDDTEDNNSKKIVFSYAADSSGKYQLQQISRCSYTKGSASWGTAVTEAQYRYYDDAGSGNRRMYRIYDAESGYGVEYTHIKSDTGFRIYTYHEYAADSVGGAQTTGAKVRTWTAQMRQTRYRDAGSDRIYETADDVVTTCFFNSSGQTINARSEDNSGELLGVTASAYEKNSGTSKKNNRMTESISSGQAGVNLLVNGGFESSVSADNIASGWKHSLSGGFAACRGSDDGSNHSGQKHYNLYNPGMSQKASIYQSVSLESGKTYTLSAYVNTSVAEAFGDGGGFVLRVFASSYGTIAESAYLDYKTDTKLDHGWQRVYLTFVAEHSDTFICYLEWKNAEGVIVVDDIQLEKGSAASRFNHVHNGSFEHAGDGWTLTGGVSAGTDQKKHGNGSLLMTASAPETSLTAEQTIELYRSSDTTFLLSGWSKGDSIPDLDQEIAGKSDTSLRYWGLTLTLNYSDNTKDEFNLPFSDYATNWQYAAMSITPKSSGKTINTATIRIHYQNNANAAYFDSISLTEEPAQTYKYDEKGNLISVKSSGNGEDGYKYDGDTQNLISVATEGSGDYEYLYENSSNKHLPTSIKNDTVTMDLVYDANGQTTQTLLKNSTDSLTMSSTAVYDDGLLLSVTDNTGSRTEYVYDTLRRVKTVKDADDTAEDAVQIRYDDIWDRPKNSYQTGRISVGSTYENGNLTKITRGGYIPGSTAKKTQEYNYTYDAFGRQTGVSIGGERIADYGYNDGNGTLKYVYYGFTAEPLASVTYGYDLLGRLDTERHYDNNSRESTEYGYAYSSDGNLAGITKNGEPVYCYDYDTLGRLIYSSRIEDGKRVLYTAHQYDTSDRILSQSWQIGEDAFEETYAYEEKDGTLSQMTVTGDDKFTFAYDNLKRLSSKTLVNEVDGTVISNILKVDYGYHNIDSTKTTARIGTMTFTRPASSIKPVPALAYSYDAVGNITKVVSGTDTLAEYTYDNQNQLVSEDDGQYLTTYTYDTYGNIRSIWVRDSETYSAVLETYEFSYADDRDWKDQLTGVTYTDYNSDGKESGMLTYDAMGNPLTYFNGKKSWNFTWKYGRQLASATDGTHTITNTYDVDGVRESKTVDGVEHKYVTLDGKIIRETYGTVTVNYFYDNEGKPYKLTVDEDNSTSGGYYTGYFVLNQQGDVIAILNANGVKVVSYEYNAWGQIKEETAASTNVGTLFLEHNALKYRGYYYDAETGFYYVSSRYYDPVIGRFINADTTDVLMASPTSLTDKNLYAYCDNNPVMRVDSDGDWWHVAVGAAVGFAAQYASNVVDNLISGESFLDSIAIKKSDIPGLLGAAASGALAATGISPEVLSFANAAINTASYVSECQITGSKIDSVELAVSVGVGFISDFTGDGGINGKKLRETYDTASKYITKSISSKKKNMYVAKQTAIKSKVKKEIRNTFIGTWSNSKICKALTSGIKWIGKWFK